MEAGVVLVFFYLDTTIQSWYVFRTSKKRANSVSITRIQTDSDKEVVA